MARVTPKSPKPLVRRELRDDPAPHAERALAAGVAQGGFGRRVRPGLRRRHAGKVARLAEQVALRVAGDGIVPLRPRAQPRKPRPAAARGERLHAGRVVVVAHVVAAQRRAQRVSQFPLQRAGGTTSCRAAGGTRPRCSAAPAPPDRPDASGTPARRAGWIRRRPSPRARTRSSRAAPGRGAGCASPGRGTRPPPGCSGTGGRRAGSGARPGSPPCSPAAARTPPGPRSRQCPWALPWPPARRGRRCRSITRRTPCCGASHPVFTRSRKAW